MKKYVLSGVFVFLGVLFVLSIYNNSNAALISLPNKIFFTSYRDGNAEIYSMKPDGSLQTRLTNNAAYDGQPSCSADTTKFVFVSGRAGNKEIYSMNTDGTSFHRITYNDANDIDPSLSSDGTKIAFCSDRDGNNEIYTMAFNGTGLTRLTYTSINERYPVWSPDEAKIAFVANNAIWVMNADGGNLMSVTNISGVQTKPSWSSQGDTIAFSCEENGNSEIYAINVDGSGLMKLTDDLAFDQDPCWSPDGSKIIFSSERSGNNELYVMNATDGLGVTNLTNNLTNDEDPCWEGIAALTSPTPTTSGSTNPTLTSVVTPTSTSAITPTPTVTSTPTPTVSSTPTLIPIPTATPTVTHTPMPTSTVSPTPTVTPTLMLTPTISLTPTATPTLTPMVTLTPTSGDNVMVTTIAGLAGQEGAIDGYGTAARFCYPGGITADNNGNLYVAEYHNHSIRKITPSGLAITIAGSAEQYGSSDGNGTAARFFYPTGITVDKSGNLYVADWCNHTIRKITPSEVVTTIAGSAGQDGSSDGVGTAARFYRPVAITIDGSDNLYVADDLNHTIRKITPSGVVTTIAGSAGQYGSSDGIGAAARFYRPFGITMDKNDNLYVAEWNNHTIRKITHFGVVTTIAGTAGQYGSSDGIGTEARFDHPCSITMDGIGNLYVTDLNNHTVRKITQSGVVTTIAGSAGQPGSVDGTGTAARFNSPAGIAVDNSGSLYVTDELNHTIRKIAFQ